MKLVIVIVLVFTYRFLAIPMVLLTFFIALMNYNLFLTLVDKPFLFIFISF